MPKFDIYKLLARVFGSPGGQVVNYYSKQYLDCQVGHWEDPGEEILGARYQVEEVTLWKKSIFFYLYFWPGGYFKGRFLKSLVKIKTIEFLYNYISYSCAKITMTLGYLKSDDGRII